MSESGFLRSLFDIRPHERRIAALMCSYFFLVITSFWILKPLKKTLFIGYYAARGFDGFGRHFEASEAELLAKVLNMFVAAIAATIFALLSRRLRRQQLTYVFTAFFVVSYGLFGVVLEDPSAIGVWGFYLFGDLFSTLMVATFFSFLNDSVSSDAAKRLYGVVGFGGVVGGVFGSSAVGVWIGSLALPSWLTITAGIGLVILIVAWAASRTLPPSPQTDDAGSGGPIDRGAAQGNPALAGARLVFRSSYLMAIVAIVGLYEVVSTILDFQFTRAIILFSLDDVARSQNFATVYATTNWAAMFVQLLLTSFVMRRFGLGVALLILPCAIAMSSTGFIVFPTLIFGGLLSVSDNAFSYSINQSSKEALYVPTSVEEKYQAKAFIDMFVQRFAKALGVGLGLLMSSQFAGADGIRWLSLMVFPFLGLWAYAAAFAGRRFKQLELAAENVRGDGPA